MNKKLYVLPFDHRSSFVKMFGFSENAMTEDEVAVIKDYKHLIYEAFLSALEMGVGKKEAAILVDERFGSEIHQAARVAGITRLLSAEKSGQTEFDFEYGSNFAEHIDALKPEYVKTLIRYNPDGDGELNARQLAKLKIINDFCKENHYGFLFELLAEPVSNGETISKSIIQLHEAGIEPDVWKIEGLEKAEEMKGVVDQIRSGGRVNAGVVVLGRGESDEKVRIWLQVAAAIPGVIGFAVGRTVFKQAILDFHEKKIDRARAVEIIAKNYKDFVDFFEKNQK